MSDSTVVDIEPSIQRRNNARNQSNGQLRKAELTDIAASETLVLATAMAQAVLSGMEMKERRRMRRLLLLIAGGLALLFGVTRMAVCLIHYQAVQ